MKMSVVIDKETGEVISNDSQQLTVADRAALAFNGNVAQLIDLAAESEGLTTITTKENYDEVKVAESRLVKMRLHITATGKTIRDDANKFAKAVIAEERRLIDHIEPEETRLKGLRLIWDEALRVEAGREFAEAEAKRKANEALSQSLEIGLNFGDGAATVEARIAAVKAVDLSAIEGLSPELLSTLSLKQMTTLEALRGALEVAKDLDSNREAHKKLRDIQIAAEANAEAARFAEAERLRKLENAPDAERLREWVKVMRSISFPVMSTEQGQATKLDIMASFDKLLSRVTVAAESLSQ
jgi:hypothetical protein